MRRGTLAALAALTLAAPLCGEVGAVEQQVDAFGTVHRISVDNWQASGKSGGTALRHTLQLPDGTSTNRWVTGTDDLAVDREPSLDLDPVTQLPLLVWSRNDGAGFEVYLSRFDGSAWSAPMPLALEPGDDVGPAIRADDNLVHVVWTHQSSPGVSSRLRLSLARPSLVPVFGPEILPTAGPSNASTTGGTGSPPPSGDEKYFASSFAAASGEDSGHIVVHGVRDAPVPVDYVQSFDLPLGLRGFENCRAGWLAGRFVVHFANADRFFYFIWEDTAWSELRAIGLGEGITAADARAQLVKSIRRDAALLAE